jgi:hypothetical protein
MHALESEVWTMIEGYENLYEISSYGRIKSYRRGEEKILKTQRNNKGYLRVELASESGRKLFLVHRLVAIAFLPNPFDKEQVNHINSTPNDNRLENLEWVTASENARHSHTHETGQGRSERSLTQRREAARTRSKPIEITCPSGEVLVFVSSNQAAKALNLCQVGLAATARGKYKQYLGYTARYLKIE